MKNIFVILIISILLLLSCNETDKQKKELVMKIMENPDKLDSLIKASIFFDEKLFNLQFLERPIATKEKIEFIKEFKKFGYYYIGNKKITVSSFRLKTKQKRDHILIGFNEQKIGCLFIFVYDENSNSWKFGDLIGYTNTLDGI